MIPNYKALLISYYLAFGMMVLLSFLVAWLLLRGNGPDDHVS